MAARLPDVNSLGPRRVPQDRRGYAQQDTTAAGRALAGLGQVVGQVGEEWQQRDDEQKVLEYRRKLIEWDKTNVHDPETGAIAKRGKDAFDLPKTLPEQFDAFAAEAAKGLTTNRQRQLGQGMALGRREQIGNWANGHALRERESFDAQEYQANVASFKDQATLYPTLAGAELANMAQTTQRYLGKRLGPEAVAAKIKADASEVHARIVSSMVKDGNVAGAEAHFKANAADMNAAARDVAQGLLKEVGTRQKVQAFEDGIRASDIPLSQALDQARAKFVDDPVTRDAAVAQVKTLYAEREAVKAQAVKQVSTDAWSVLMEKGSMSAIPSATMTALRNTAPEEERKMRDWLEAKWRRAKADAEGTGNDYTPERVRAFAGLLRMAAEEPATFADADLSKQMPFLTKPHLNHLLTMQGSINRNEAKATDVAKLTMSTMKGINQAIADAGVKLSGKRSEEQMKQAAMLETQLFEALQVEAAGGKLDSAKAREIGMGLLREGIEQGSGGWFSGPTKKLGYQIRAEREAGVVKDYITATFDKIPASARDEIVNDLRRMQPGAGPRGALSDQQKAAVEREYQRRIQEGRYR